MVYVPCDLCGSDRATVFGRIDDSQDPRVLHRTSVRCTRCGLVYSNPQATRETFEHFYSATYPDLSEYLRHIDARHSFHAAVFADLPDGQGKRFLDIGCATGHLLVVGRARGWEVHGVELSQHFSQYARDTFALENVRTGELCDAKYPSAFFDYVNMWHTLEHVPNATKVLHEVARIMKPAASVRIGVPNIAEPYQWIGRAASRIRGNVPGMPSADHHTYHFTPSTLRRMVQKAGLHIRKQQLYYDLGRHDLADRGNWLGRIETRLVGTVARVLPDRVGSKMSVIAYKKERCLP